MRRIRIFGYLFSIAPVFFLGSLFFCANVNENVSFEEGGDGSAKLQLNLRDLDNMLPSAYHCKREQIKMKMDSIAVRIEEGIRGKTQQAQCKYDSAFGTLNIQFNFSRPEDLNAVLAMFSGDENIYTFSKRKVQRDATPLFFLNSDALKSSATPDYRSKFYHSYKLRVGLPPGEKRVTIDHPDAFVRQNGDIVELEQDIRKAQEGHVLAINISYKQYR